MLLSTILFHLNSFHSLGLETLVKTNVDCICEAIKSNTQLGIGMNITRVLALPSTCGMSTSHPLPHCAVTIDFHLSLPVSLSYYDSFLLI